MGDERTTDERVNILERMLFALLTNGVPEHSAIYRSLWEMLLEHPGDRVSPKRREIEADEIVKFFRRWTVSPSIESSDFLATLGDAVPLLRNQLRKLESARKSDFDSQASRLERIEHEIGPVWHDYTELLLVLSNSDALKAEKFRRVLPSHAYLSANAPAAGNRLVQAMNELAAAIGFEVFTEGESKSGSWLKESLHRARQALTKPEVQKRLGKAERALELKHIDLVHPRLTSIWLLPALR
jgi:hypothetical protein